MSCKTLVKFWVPAGNDYRATEVKCGWTDPWGGRVTCPSCRELRGRDILAREREIAADDAACRASGIGEY